MQRGLVGSEMCIRDRPDKTDSDHSGFVEQQNPSIRSERENSAGEIQCPPQHWIVQITNPTLSQRHSEHSSKEIDFSQSNDNSPTGKRKRPTKKSFEPLVPLSQKRLAIASSRPIREPQAGGPKVIKKKAERNDQESNKHLFSLANMIVTSEAKKLADAQVRKLDIPSFATLSSSHYSLASPESEEESDDDEKYYKLHRKNEILEAMLKHFDEQEILTPYWQNGLIIRIALDGPRLLKKQSCRSQCLRKIFILRLICCCYQILSLIHI
eukprot:TRINITY_DN44596_c0_g1_i1.p1 TRINITY_DN44596_c0_g1~~TRINITY_DN44596_c0_g1_i1.p1  ORF type:complete len:268 (-),score=32.44 TRINITY_DN44596_c0_g1_i1:173-976(-)